MEAIQCIKERRSIRVFENKEIPAEVIEQIVSAAAYAPSWKNTQVTRYTAVTGDTKAKLSECTKIWAGNGRIMNGAPMVIAISVVKGRCGYERDGSFSTSKKDGWQMFDAGIATQTFCLAAHNAGLGTVIMGLYDDNAREVLELPEEQELVALVAIGYPAESPAAPKRKDVSDLLTYK